MALNIKKVSKDQLPKTNVPGRQRQPSEFDELMDEAYGDREWRAVNFDGTVDGLNHLLSELNRAATFKNYGKSIRGGMDENGEPYRDEDGDPVFYFQIRDKLATGRRGPRNVDGAESDDDETGDEITDVETTEVEAETETSGKRGRKRNSDPVTAGSW